MPNQDEMLTMEGLAFKMPVLLASPYWEYAAIFERAGEVVVLQSQDGRCIQAYPVRPHASANTAAACRSRFMALGYLEQVDASDSAREGVRQFMSAAGFSLRQVNQTFKLGNPCYA